MRQPRHASELLAALRVSQPTLSRALAKMEGRVLRIGRARATRYALLHELGRAGSRWPLYRLDTKGRPQRLGELRNLHGENVHFEPEIALPAFTHDEFSQGLYPGLPWFLDDQRPQGFLGRAFAHRIAPLLDAKPDIRHWNRDDVLLALLRFGEDQPGDLLLGEAALEAAMRLSHTQENLFNQSQRETDYPALAEAVLHGEAVGSSAAGEQPKFAITLRDGDARRAVIVKFSERITTAGGRRWADLLICEHLVGEVLHAHGIPAAQSTIVEADGRIFHESTRFDRSAEGGRHGFVSLAALDAAFIGVARQEWHRFAPVLCAEGWITPEDAHRLSVLGLFGDLIGNADMHLGNAGVILTNTRPLALAPAYDMLPMRFRPASNGEVLPREFMPVMPLPEFHAPWLQAAVMAQEFWKKAADDVRISDGFRGIAERAGQAVAALRLRLA